ncbi:hypothetical protein [uncultured Brevundimonas sp.]|uniref:hypothetical protein n=1 Tax=uncultured Brevundimonas sp. TaxID=213418 RepID=UPI0025D03F19|nr:hypothetical protein [uncultured Brevundimonas sp.]
MTRRVTRVPPDGRRAIILRSTIDDFLTLSDVDRMVKSRLKRADPDPSIDRLKTRAALKDLQRAQLVARTPYGWRCTGAGQAVLEASSEHRA